MRLIAYSERLVVLALDVPVSVLLNHFLNDKALETRSSNSWQHANELLETLVYSCSLARSRP